MYSKKYRECAFKDATTYWFSLSKPIICEIPIDGLKYFKGSINPYSECDLCSGYFSYLFLFSGAFLPPDQGSLEIKFKEKLYNDFKIEFNHLFTITNLPISRFLDYLIASENYEEYMETLVNRFNPNATKELMCKNTISVSWEGYIYDCDFNQMLDLKINSKTNTVFNCKIERLVDKKVEVSQHCYGCTAGAGSSCQGSIA